MLKRRYESAVASQVKTATPVILQDLVTAANQAKACCVTAAVMRTFKFDFGRLKRACNRVFEP
jgi:hypothetical protein